MAKSSRARMYEFVYDLPYLPRKELCKILDVDRSWELLGGKYMKVNYTDLRLLRTKDSPTDEILKLLEGHNTTIQTLFLMLNDMGHQRAMRVLAPYVDDRSQDLLREDFYCSQIFKEKQVPSDYVPTHPPLPPLPSNQKLPSKPGYNDSSQYSSFCGSSHHANNLSKFSAHPDNFNETTSTVSLPSKLKNMNLNASFGSCDLCTIKSQMPYAGHSSSPGSGMYESLVDNCAYDGIQHSKTLNQDKKENNVTKVISDSNICAKKEFTREVSKHKESYCKAGKPSVGECLRQDVDKGGGDVMLVMSPETLPSVVQIPYKELQAATCDFSPNRILGQGGFGIVYKGEWKQVSVAVKKLQPKESKDSASRQEVSLKQSLNELKILNSYRFDNILPLYGICLDGPDPCLVYQFMANGSLEDRLLCKRNSTPLTWHQRVHIAEGTAKGLNYLHTINPSKPLVHGDIKSANILLDGNMEPKIGDFGLTREGPARQYTHMKVSEVHGTQVYLPTEYLKQHRLSTKVDVYSYGVVMLEIATGLRPFDEKRIKAKALVDYVEDCCPEKELNLRDVKAGTEGQDWFKELLKIGMKCAKHSKHERPEMKEVLELFDKAHRGTAVAEMVRKISQDREHKSDVCTITPKEIQRYYDKQNEHHRADMQPPPGPGRSPLQNVTSIKEPPTSDSIHPSQIRAPPASEMDDSRFHLMHHYPHLTEDSSCAATVGSSHLYPGSSLSPGGGNNQKFDTTSSGPCTVPLLTELLDSDCPLQRMTPPSSSKPQHSGNIAPPMATNNLNSNAELADSVVIVPDLRSGRSSLDAILGGMDDSFDCSGQLSEEGIAH